MSTNSFNPLTRMIKHFNLEGNQMVPFDLKVLIIFDLCSNTQVLITWLDSCLNLLNCRKNLITVCAYKNKHTACDCSQRPFNTLPKVDQVICSANADSLQ